MVAGVTLTVVILGLGAWLMQPPTITLTLKPIPKQSILENEILTVKPELAVSGIPETGVRFGIIEGSPGAEINPKTGVFTWKPTEEQGPKTHKVEIGVKATGPHKSSTARKFLVVVKEVNDAPVILNLAEQTVIAGNTIKVVIQGNDPDIPPVPLEYRFGKTFPSGASLDPLTGAFEWTAPAASLEHDEVATIVVGESTGKKPLNAEVSLKIHVTALASAAERIAGSLAESGLSVDKIGGDLPEGFSGSVKGYLLNNETLMVLEYPTAQEAAADFKEISSDGTSLFGKPYQWSQATRIYRAQQTIAFFTGNEGKTLASLEKLLGKPVITTPVADSTPLTTKVQIAKTGAEKLGEALFGLHQEKKLLSKKEYPAIRKLFAQEIEQQHQTLLIPIFEGDGASLRKWFDANPTYWEEFLIAISPEDDLSRALGILITLHEKFPRQFEGYFALATAIALTWDKESSVFDYEHQARRTHSIYPDKLADATANFQFFLDAEKLMQGRAQLLPWEFLKHVVNHKTPVSEREWALQRYLSKRVDFGKCYSDVPYDTQMLDTGGKVCKLDGKPYTLPNILTLGGVCAMQADYAARVGKSIGVPAEYVTGEGRYGGLHAWVMWVELQQVTKTGIVFSLKSHGRYFDDNYYIGNIRDPQTGTPITDRQLELRLHAVGLDPIAYRMTNLIMSAYPSLLQAAGWNTNEEIVFLNDLIELSPGNEQAWTTVARLARDGKIETASFRLMNTMFEKLFRTFANFPDFTWTVFDDLVSFQKNVKQRNRYFERLVQMYEAAGRPDLACEARILLSDYLVEEGRTKDVLNGLAFTITKFPEEGVFVPKLLDKIEVLAANIKDSEPQVLQLYQKLLQLIPPKRGDRASDYYMSMLDRAAKKFKAAGQTQQAQAYEGQLAKMKLAK